MDLLKLFAVWVGRHLMKIRLLVNDAITTTVAVEFGIIVEQSFNL